MQHLKNIQVSIQCAWTYLYICTHEKNLSYSLNSGSYSSLFRSSFISTNNAKNLPCSRASALLIYGLG